MRRPQRLPLLACLLAPVVLLPSACASPRKWAPPEIDAPDDEAEVARGRYLGEHVAICTTCHSRRDYRYLGAPPEPGTEGAGGPIVPELFRAPPDVVVPATNITPVGLGDWTDGEVFRAIAGGLGREGQSLFPGHPYFQFKEMPEQDLLAIIAWLRTLEPRESDLPQRDLVYPSLERIINIWPRPPPIAAERPAAGSREYARRLLDSAGCLWCHSPQDHLAFPIKGREYSGGVPFPVPPPGAGVAWSTNLTPDPVSGIGNWSRQDFVRRFKAATPEAIRSREIPPGGFNSMMPWAAYSGMTEDDLGCIYEELMRLRPIRTRWPRWTPPVEEGAR